MGSKQNIMHRSHARTCIGTHLRRLAALILLSPVLDMVLLVATRATQH
jgi:hypothetical protein